MKYTVDTDKMIIYTEGIISTDEMSNLKLNYVGFKILNSPPKIKIQPLTQEVWDKFKQFYTNPEGKGLQRGNEYQPICCKDNIIVIRGNGVYQKILKPVSDRPQPPKPSK